MKSRLSISVLSILFLLMAWPSSQAVFAQDGERLEGRTISVSGEGTARVAPDKATVRFGVVSRGDDAEEARMENEQAAREALDSVRELGIPEERIQLESMRLQPRYDRDPDTRERREVGFEATRNLVVELDDVEMVAIVIAEVIQHGANRVNSVSYDKEDRSGVRNEALQSAARDARQKAHQLATALDAEVGEVLQIHEQSFSFPRPHLRAEQFEHAMAADVAGGDPEAYAPGEIEVNADVRVIFRLQ